MGVVIRLGVKMPGAPVAGPLGVDLRVNGGKVLVACLAGLVVVNGRADFA